MSRRITTLQLQTTQGGQVDTYFDRVVKYIPADIIAAWTTATGLIASATNVPSKLLSWIVFSVGLILTPWWIYKQTNKPPLPAARTQILIGTLAFAVWVFALGGPFKDLGFYRPLYGSLLLMLFTLIVGRIQPQE
jgi:hypothetical protein